MNTIKIKNAMDQKLFFCICAFFEFDQGRLVAKATRNIQNTNEAEAIDVKKCHLWFSVFSESKLTRSL